jgi:hypothetical protein
MKLYNEPHNAIITQCQLYNEPHNADIIKQYHTMNHTLISLNEPYNEPYGWGAIATHTYPFLYYLFYGDIIK